MKKNAFTLIELIVVIMILAVLGAISFVYFQSYSANARDTKRISDIRSLLTKITTEQAKGISLENFMDIDEQKTNNLTINGEGGKEGKQGVLNFQTLKEQPNSFKDPKSNTDYPFAYAVGIINGGETKNDKYEFLGLATIIESKKESMILGNYFQYDTQKDSPSLFTDEYGDYIENGSKDLIYNPGLVVESKDCDTQMTDENYTLEEAIFNKTQTTLTKPGNENNGIIEHGNITKEQDYLCNRGKLEEIGAERTIVNCINEENQEYIPYGEACVASLCNGDLPQFAEQNGQQTNQGIWHFSNTQNQCAYKCISGYTYDDTENPSCKKDCSEIAISEWGYENIPATKHNQMTPNLTRTGTILGGTQTFTRNFTCENGEFIPNEETTINVNCDINYTAQADKTCKAGTKIFTCSDKPTIGTEWNSVSSYTQTWDGTAWTPAESETAYNLITSTTECRFKCNTDYTYDSETINCVETTYTFKNHLVNIIDWNLNFTFPDFTMSIGEQKQVTSNVLTIPNGNIAISVTFERLQDGSLYTSSGEIDNGIINCSEGYDFDIQNGQAGCYLMKTTKTDFTINMSNRGVSFLFPEFTLIYGTPLQVTSRPLAINNGTATITATFILGADWTISVKDGALDYENFHCISGVIRIDDGVLGCYRSLQPTTNNTMPGCPSNNFNAGSYEIASCDIGPNPIASPGCPSGYHLASKTEWEGLATHWGDDLDKMASDLVMQNCRAYWTSTIINGITLNDGNAYRVFAPCTGYGIYGIAGNINGAKTSTGGENANLVRCFKN